MKILKPFKGAHLSNVTQAFHELHKAIDWLPFRKLGAYGTPLVSPERCIVGKIYGNNYTPDDSAPMKNGFGLFLKGLDTGLEHLYWHTLPIMPVKTGDTVERGQIVAYCGNSGNVFSGGVYVPLEERNADNKAGTHLHQAVFEKGVVVDPLLFIELNVEPSYSLFEELSALRKTLLIMSGVIKG
jgi:murein DD-endopeptidase MepM/ murein hydrolase activator NlpD